MADETRPARFERPAALAAASDADVEGWVDSGDLPFDRYRYLSVTSDGAMVWVDGRIDTAAVRLLRAA